VRLDQCAERGELAEAGVELDVTECVTDGDIGAAGGVDSALLDLPRNREPSSVMPGWSRIGGP